MTTPDDLTPERIRKIHESADLATACLNTCSVHVEMRGQKFIVRAYPWECLDVARSLYLCGAVGVSVFPGTGQDAWHWFKARPLRALSLTT